MSAEKSAVLTFLKSDTGKKFVESFKSLSDSVKHIQDFFAEQLPELLLQVPESGSNRVKRKRKEKDPLAPKHPLSSYMIFSKEIRPILKEEQPDLDPKLVVQEIGKRWRELTPELKKKYEEEAIELKNDYNQEKARYDESKNIQLPAAEDSSSEEESDSSESEASDSESVVSEPSEKVVAVPVVPEVVKKPKKAEPKEKVVAAPKPMKSAPTSVVKPKPVLQEVQSQSQATPVKEKKHKKSKKAPTSPDLEKVSSAKKSKKSVPAA